MTRKIVSPPPSSLKDPRGAYLPQEPEGVSPPSSLAPDPALSIDVLMKRGLLAIDRTLTLVLRNVSGGNPSREDIMNLKDCMGMLQTLKERESELLEEMSLEDLEKL